MNLDRVHILGIPFFNGQVENVFEELDRFLNSVTDISSAMNPSMEYDQKLITGHRNDRPLINQKIVVGPVNVVPVWDVLVKDYYSRYAVYHNVT